MAKWVSGTRAVVVLLATLWAGALGSIASAAAFRPPLFGQAGAGLVAPGGVEQMAKPAVPAGAQKMADNFNKAGTADAAAPAAAGPPAAAATGGAAAGGSLQNFLLKYGPSYVMMVLAISLGLFVVCRPAGFSLETLAALADRKKAKKDTP